MSDLFYSSFEERNRGSRSLIKSRLKAYLPFVEPLLAHDRLSKAIDLGCGRGEWLETLGEAGFDACGVDLDEGMLIGCRANGLNARHADALLALQELPDNSMALVSAFHVVEHVPFDYARALVREALRVLKPAGLLILETPNPENIVVGTSLFYLDPSHLRPIPPELLSFVVEYEKFHRHIVARLQESPELLTNAHIGLVNVFAGVSPDYGVVAQKSASPELLSAFDRPFDARYGITLGEISHRYEIQEQTRIASLFAESDTHAEHRAANIDAWITDVEHHLTNKFAYLDDRSTTLEERTTHLEGRATHLDNRDAYLEDRINHLGDRLAQAEQHAANLGEQLLATLNSHSWRITAPLRWLGNQARLVRRDGLISRAKAMVMKIARPLMRRVRKEVPLTYAKISGKARATGNQPAKNELPEAVEPTDLTPRAGKIYSNLKSAIERNKESS